MVARNTVHGIKAVADRKAMGGGRGYSGGRREYVNMRDIMVRKRGKGKDKENISVKHDENHVQLE